MALSSVTVKADGDPERNTNQPVQKQLPLLTRWYRSALFNVIIVGLISFTQPGIWNALNSKRCFQSLDQKPYLFNGANSLTFGTMVFGCPLFSILANRYGLQRVLILGTLGYAPYSASLYVNNRYGTEWFLGQLIGSSSQLSLNVKDGERGKVGYSTYLVLIALQCLGLPLAFLISHPSKVIRPDGSSIPDPSKQKAVLGEFHKLWAQVKKKHILLLIPILVGFNWNSTYQATAASMFWGWVFDLKVIIRPRLARITWFTFAVIMLSLLGWQLANEKLYEDTQPTIDWAQPDFGRGFASHYMFVYWILGVCNGDLETLALTVGIVRCFESVGSCLAFGIGAAEVSPMVNLIVAFVMFVLCIPTTSCVVFMVPDHSESAPKNDESSQAALPSIKAGAMGPAAQWLSFLVV
ncbi:uncharacterized protein BDV17DRAFT_297717 [Aspergillus undulatus]|uniref:uncharacterized protein n=1 Tax=Aspergillus undulatus TaxID=1810928 RepID=UPI003CCC9CB1